MRSELTILALWETIYITGLILALFLIAVVFYVLQSTRIPQLIGVKVESAARFAW